MKLDREGRQNLKRRNEGMRQFPTKNTEDKNVKINEWKAGKIAPEKYLNWENILFGQFQARTKALTATMATKK